MAELGVETNHHHLSWALPVLFCPSGISSALVLLPWCCSLSKLPYTGPDHFAKPLSIFFLKGFPEFGSILIWLKVTGYLLRWRLDGCPIKEHPYNGADGIFQKKGWSGAELSGPGRALRRAPAWAGRIGREEGRAELAHGWGKVTLLKQGKPL